MTPTEASVTWEQALAWRLRRQLLDPVGDRGTADVVRRLGAVLSHDASLAELTVRTRQRASPGQDSGGLAGGLAGAVADGSVLHTFAFRGATHHLPPVEGADVLALRAAGRQWERRSWVEHYGLAPEAWPDFRATVRDALAEGPRHLDELLAEVTGHPPYRHLGPVLDRDPWTVLKALSWQGDLCFGPPHDGRATFQRPDALPHWPGIPDLDDAGPRAITAYLRRHGPATPEHVHHWLGSGLSAGRRRLDRWWQQLLTTGALAPVDVEGTTAYVVRDDLEGLRSAAPSDAVRLLPGHDPWVMGPGTHDEHVVPPALRDAVTRKNNLVVVGGVVRGTWKVTGGRVEVMTGGAAESDLAAEVDRLARILGRDLRIALVP